MPKKQITIGPLSQEDEQRFWKKVQRNGPSGCGLWLGATFGPAQIKHCSLPPKRLDEQVARLPMLNEHAR